MFKYISLNFWDYIVILLNLLGLSMIYPKTQFTGYSKLMAHMGPPGSHFLTLSKDNDFPMGNATLHK